MLWYKSWLETRARFLISLTGIVVLCSYFVFRQDREALPYVGISYYYGVLFAGHQSLATLWVLAVTLLGMGGLLRERAVGASSFTLALPVSRTRVMGVRIGIGLLQAILLAIVPWISMLLVANVAGKALPRAQPGFYLVLLAAGGLVFFTMAVLISTLVEGEYTAPVVAFGVVIAMAFIFDSPALRPYSLWRLILGANYIDRTTFLLSGSPPWIHILASMLLAALLLLISIKVIQRREF